MVGGDPPGSAKMHRSGLQLFDYNSGSSFSGLTQITPSPLNRGRGRGVPLGLGLGLGV